MLQASMLWVTFGYVFNHCFIACIGIAICWLNSCTYNQLHICLHLAQLSDFLHAWMFCFTTLILSSVCNPDHSSALGAVVVSYTQRQHDPYFWATTDIDLLLIHAIPFVNSEHRFQLHLCSVSGLQGLQESFGSCGQHNPWLIWPVLRLVHVQPGIVGAPMNH